MPVEGYNLSAKMRTGFINLSLETARLVGTTAGESWANATAAVGTLGGGLLSSATVPSLTANSTLLRVISANWTSVGTSVSSATFNVLSGRVSAASSDTAPSWLVNIYPSTGSSATLSIPITNITSSVPTQYSGALSTVAIPLGYPGVVSFVINPASSQDLNKLYGAWIEYQRAPRG